ncbi:hypothetical protein ACFWJ4_18875 [Kitasatospora sp. NPDC127067]|uniref:hypothetical protein n=1 Tax=Kitasatospora sp. NPDC127067 TaxID=3347126 RepID=UPI00365B7733
MGELVIIVESPAGVRSEQVSARLDQLLSGLSLAEFGSSASVETECNDADGQPERAVDPVSLVAGVTVFLTGLTLTAAAARRLIDEMTRIFRSLDEAKHAWLVLRGGRVDLRAVEPADVPTEAVLGTAAEEDPSS